ncbi:MAG: Clp1/GlmU family protein [Candidatus Bathyarchaeia archaeon]|jgi:polynucleotide 5'-hydroxyl-kinase GRC3/NOL9
MKLLVDKGKTLLVDGPASVSLLSGEVTVLGASIAVEEKLVVREGKRLPLWVSANATLELNVGEGASINEVEGGSVPPSWDEAAKQVFGQNLPVTVLVVGGVDSGKTSFCTYLVNQSVLNKWRTFVVDADLGQSDVGPPSTIGFALVSEPVKDLFDLSAEDAVFVGATNPSIAINKVIEGLTQLKTKILDSGADLVVINTDGWVEGEEAAAYKVRLVNELCPNVVVGLQRADELTPILGVSNDSTVVVMGSPELIYSRSREKRKLLRELSYKKYLKGGKVQSFSLGWIDVECSILGAGGKLHHKRLETLRNLLKTNFVYSEESLNAVLVVLGRVGSVSEESIEAAEEYFGKRVKVIRQGDEEGLLVGLKDENNHFMGIGILQEVDYKRKTLKVFTPVLEKVSAICFGNIVLDKNCKELGLCTVYTNSL